MISLKRPLRLLAAAGVLSLATTLVAAAGAGASSSPPALGAYTTKGAYNYVSTPRLHPPKLAADAAVSSKQFKALAPGFFMLANFKDLTASKPMVGQSGPLMLDHSLAPVWFRPVPTNVLATNLTDQTFNGKPALSWWQGVVTEHRPDRQRRGRRRQPAVQDGGHAQGRERLDGRSA